MPKSLKITSGTLVDHAIAIINDDENYFRKILSYPWTEKEGLKTIKQVKEYLANSVDPKSLREGHIAINNKKLYGHQDWHSWSTDNWGTKWNAYDQTEEIEMDTIEVKSPYKESNSYTLHTAKIKFDTAWSTPFPVMEKLAKKFPKLIVEVKFASEDIGQNCGIYKFEGGKLTEEYQPSGIEADKFACEIRGYDFKDYICDNIECWDVEKMKESKNKEIFIDLLQKGYATQLIRNLYPDSEEGKEVVKFLKELALENELYEAITEIESAS